MVTALTVTGVTQQFGVVRVEFVDDAGKKHLALFSAPLGVTLLEAVRCKTLDESLVGKKVTATVVQTSAAQCADGGYFGYVVVGSCSKG